MSLVIHGRSPWMRPSNLEEFFSLPELWDSSHTSVKSLAADVYETADEVVVELSVPGVKPEELSINVTGDVLTITGESKKEAEVKKRDYFQKQISYGSFAQSVSLPTAVQSEKAEANFEHGILKINLPKAEESKPKKIEVKVK